MFTQILTIDAKKLTLFCMISFGRSVKVPYLYSYKR